MRTRSVVGLVLAVHIMWTVTFLVLGNDILDVARISEKHLVVPEPSARITEAVYDGADRSGNPVIHHFGHDGQFYLYMALDLKGARDYLDIPGYRYTRPLYPLAARTLAAGSADLIPWALLLLNIAAIGLGTFAVARFLRRNELTESLALVYGLSPGLLVAVQRDLTEPLAHGLAALAVLVFSTTSTRRWLGAAAILALAGFARQTTLVFAFPLAALLALAPLGAAARPRLSTASLLRAGTFLAVAGLPYTILLIALHSAYGLTSGDGNFTAIPLSGVFAHEFRLSRHGVSITTVVIPVLLWTATAVIALRRTRWNVPAAVPLAMAAAVVLNALLLVVFNVDSNTYIARGRSATGVVLAAVLAAPLLLRAQVGQRLWFAAAALWLVILPAVWVTGLDADGWG